MSDQVLRTLTRRLTSPAVVAAAIAGLAVLVLVQQFVTVGGSDLLGRTINNWLHVPMFAGVALLLFLALGKPSWPVLLGSCILLAVATEAAQLLTGRSASLLDVGRDMVGAVPVLIAIELTRQHGRRLGRSGRRLVWGLTLAVLTVVTLAAPLRVLMLYQQRDQLFPLLLSPGNSGLEALFTTTSRPRLTTAPEDWRGYAGEIVLAVTWNREPFPGIHLLEVPPLWQGYGYLVVDVYLPQGPPMVLTAAVGHAGQAGGGTAAYVARTVARGPQRLCYDLTSLLEPIGEGPVRISKLILHTSEKEAGRKLLFGRVRLVRPGGHDCHDPGNLALLRRPPGR